MLGNSMIFHYTSMIFHDINIIFSLLFIFYTCTAHKFAANLKNLTENLRQKIKIQRTCGTCFCKFAMIFTEHVKSLSLMFVCVLVCVCVCPSYAFWNCEERGLLTLNALFFGGEGLMNIGIFHKSLLLIKFHVKLTF